MRHASKVCVRSEGRVVCGTPRKRLAWKGRQSPNRACIISNGVKVCGVRVKPPAPLNTRATRKNPGLGEWLRLKLTPKSTPMEVQPIGVGSWVADRGGLIMRVVRFNPGGVAEVRSVMTGSNWEYPLHELHVSKAPLQPGALVDVGRTRYAVFRHYSEHLIELADAKGRVREMRVASVKPVSFALKR